MTAGAGRRANAVIAGVNKAGTSSLFVTLASHPQVAASAVKETRYFLPARWGRSLDPIADYEACFAEAGDRPIRLEATPAYFYGGDALVSALHAVLGEPRVLVVFREPVARFVSFFSYQQARLRLPTDMTIEEYLEATVDRPAASFASPEDEVWFGFRGGCYEEYLAPWVNGSGARLHVVFFEQLLAQPDRRLAEIAEFLGIDPDGFPARGLASENRTTGYRSRGLQRVALGVNDRFERFLRRHRRLEDGLRGIYYRLNGRSERVAVPVAVRDELAERYRAPNARLAVALRAAGVTDLPDWLASAVRRDA